MQHTKLITQHANGTRARFHLSPPVRFPDKLHLTGYMTNGGVSGTPLVIRVGGVRSSSEAYVLSTTSGAAQLGSAVIVVSEPTSCKWQHSYPHALGAFEAQELHYLDVEIMDSSTQLTAAYSPPNGVTNIVVLEFTISHRDHRFAPGTLPQYKYDMYNALG